MTIAELRQFVACDNRPHFQAHLVAIHYAQLKYCYAQLSCFILLLQAANAMAAFFLPVAFRNIVSVSIRLLSVDKFHQNYHYSLEEHGKYHPTLP